MQAEEDVSWLEGGDLEELSEYTLETWIQRGPKVYNMDGFKDFCNPKILQKVLNSKVCITVIKQRFCISLL